MLRSCNTRTFLYCSIPRCFLCSIPLIFIRYDYEEDRNLNIIQTQGGEADGPLFSNEQANGTSYYYHPEKPKEKYCDVRARNCCNSFVSCVLSWWLGGLTFGGGTLPGGANGAASCLWLPMQIKAKIC